MGHQRVREIGTARIYVNVGVGVAKHTFVSEQSNDRNWEESGVPFSNRYLPVMIYRLRFRRWSILDKNLHSVSLATAGFLAAGASNIVGMLAVSKLFTNPLLAANDPAVFSWLGQIAVVLWGFAYLAVARSYHRVPFLLFVFFIEKMVYVVAWLLWLSNKGHTLPQIAASSPMTAGFFTAYGASDALFGLFFGVMCIRALKESRAN